MVLLRKRHNSVHVACYTGIMHRHDHLRPRGDECFKRLSIDIGIALHRVGKHHLCPFAQECQCRTDESITGDDHLVSGLQVTQHRAHLQGIRTAGRQQAFTKTVPLLEPSLTGFGELTVSGQLTRVHRFVHVMGLFTRQMRLVKIYHKKNTITPIIMMPIATALRRLICSLKNNRLRIGTNK